jgi:RNA polymerase sigma-70 factor (ECF subfamily)
MSRFQDLLSRVRAGDNEASAELFETYAPHLKRLVSSWMRVESMRRRADASDIYQSVMASFFVRAALGEYDISGPEQLKALLARIARNKVADLARRPDRTTELPDTGPGLSGIASALAVPSPASRLAWKDLLEAVQNRFTVAERQVSDLRMVGHSWEEVAAKLGGRPDALRMRLDRALKRISAELNLEELLHD